METEGIEGRGKGGQELKFLITGSRSENAMVSGSAWSVIRSVLGRYMSNTELFQGCP